MAAYARYRNYYISTDLLAYFDEWHSIASVHSDNDVYFTHATSNSRTDKYRTVVEQHIKTVILYNAKKDNYCVGRVESWVS